MFSNSVTVDAGGTGNSWNESGSIRDLGAG